MSPITAICRYMRTTETAWSWATWALEGTSSTPVVHSSRGKCDESKVNRRPDHSGRQYLAAFRAASADRGTVSPRARAATSCHATQGSREGDLEGMRCPGVCKRGA